MTTVKTTTAQPAQTISFGRGEWEVQVTRWENEYKAGKFSRSYSITRSFKQEDGTWKRTSSFKLEHLPIIIILLIRAIIGGIQVKDFIKTNDKEEAAPEIDDEGTPEF